jgi:hypothetical protein
MADVDRNDLDETRRLLYMALLEPRTERWPNLGGTLINALAHHSGRAAAEECIAHLRALCGPRDETTDEAIAAAKAWAQALIDQITADLG